MRDQIVLYNPHVDDFLAEPPHFRLLKRKSLKKYGFLIDVLQNTHGGVSVMIDGTVSSFIHPRYFRLMPKLLRQIVSTFEYELWLRINKFTKFKRIAASSPNLGEYTLLAFSYKAVTGNFELRASLLLKFRHVLFHLSHYFVSTSEKAVNIKKLPNAWLVGDSDPSENEYFQFFFGWYQKRFLTLPFAVKSRFKDKNPLLQRESRCIATGSVHDLHLELPTKAYVDYISHSGLYTYHPVRKQIYDDRDRISLQVECMVAPYRNYQSSSILKEWMRHFFVSQKNYFSIDIVEAYNRYKFAVVGEEMTGFPALGMLEAMACGCIVFADPRRLQGLNLQANSHYLPYDGTLDGLLNALSLAVGRTDLELISAAGQQIAKELFSENAVGQLWLEIIHSLP